MGTEAILKPFVCDNPECEEGYTPSGETCQDCCCHEFDPSEGFMCINCNKEGLS